MPWHFGYQGIGGLRAIVDAKSGKILKSVQDLQGNILGYIKAGEVIWKEDVYDAYGPIGKGGISQGNLAEALMKRHSWRGKRVDATGLIWMGTRYYNPSNARFLSLDPYGHAGSIDLYSYANGNPVKYCDPDGRCPHSAHDGETDWGDEIFSGLLDLAPGVGNAKSFAELVTGENLITKKPLSPVEKAVTVIGLFVPQLKPIAKAFKAGKAVIGGSSLAKNVLKAADVTLDGINQGLRKIGATGKIGEDALKMAGGQSQVYKSTPIGGRYIDQLVDKVAHEAKVGYVSLTPTIKRQIAKDAELLAQADIKKYFWHFHKSPITGKVGPSASVAEQLRKHGISYYIHYPTHVSLHY